MIQKFDRLCWLSRNCSSSIWPLIKPIKVSLISDEGVALRWILTISIGESPIVHHDILPYIHTLVELEYLSRFIIDLSQLIRKTFQSSAHLDSDIMNALVAFCGFVFRGLVGEETSFSSKLKSSHVMIVVWIWRMAYNSTKTHTSIHNGGFNPGCWQAWELCLLPLSYV